MSKATAELIIRHLLGIVAALRNEYDIPDRKSSPVEIVNKGDIAGAVNYVIGRVKVEKQV